MGAKEELQALVKKINENPENIQNEKNCIFQFNLEESGSLQIILKDGQIALAEGANFEPQVTLSMSDQNFSKLLKDNLNTTLAFMTGGLKVEGNLGLALKLQDIVKKYQ